MWFLNIFRKHRKQPEPDHDEEAARFPNAASLQTGAHFDLKKRTQEQLKPKGPGFDPYNSGTFKKDDAWKRVTRR